MVSRACAAVVVMLACAVAPQARAADHADHSDPGVARAQRLLLDAGYDALPRISVVGIETAADLAPAHADAFTVAVENSFGAFRNRVVYILESSRALAGARSGDAASVALLAATIVHEIAHQDGADEREAIGEQIAFVTRIIGSALTSASVRSTLLDHRAQLQTHANDLAAEAGR